MDNIKVICAWCKKVLKEGIKPISHGICEECVTKVTKETLDKRVNTSILESHKIEHGG